MKTLIIGAGLVGSQIARILVDLGERPVLFDRALQPGPLSEIVDPKAVDFAEGDVLRPLSLARSVREHGVDGIVHLAANPMLTLGAQKDPQSAIELNIVGTVNVYETARSLGVKRVVVASSNVLNHFMAGGDGGGDTAKEEAFPRPTTFYAATKQAVESIGLNYARWCQLEFAAVRYGAVAGPWSGHGGGGPSNVMREAIETALAGGEAFVPSSGLEWVYSKDAALGTVRALKARELGSGVFNITMGYVCGPEELADAIRKAVPGAKVRIAPPVKDAVALPNMLRGSDLTLAKRWLDFVPKYRMAEAVADLTEWIKSRR